jgi:hypothetical protein
VLSYFSGSRKAALSWHAGVQENDVGAIFKSPSDNVVGVLYLTHDGEMRFEQRADTFQDERMVIDENILIASVLKYSILRGTVG